MAFFTIICLLFKIILNLRIMEATADLLKEGEKAKIAGLKEGQFSLKLAEMGCVPGTEIIRLYESAGGNTIAYRIDTYLLGLRKEEARLIEVEPIEASIA